MPQPFVYPHGHIYAHDIRYCSQSLLDALQLQLYLVCLDFFRRLAPVPSKCVKLLRKLRKKLCSTWRNTFLSPDSFRNNYFMHTRINLLQ